ncbi:MAG: phage portal protein [Clostridia bacterium]|nr:phage portal protein [Clostridia bacterium]
MSLFKKREELVEVRDVPLISPPVDDVLLRALLDGSPVTREQAMTLPAVSGAVDFIAGTIASMPVKLYKTKQGKVEEVRDDVRVRMLNSDTGDMLDAWQLKKSLIEDYILGSGGYCYIQRDGNTVTGLYYVRDIDISILRTFDPIFKSYTIMVYDREFKPYEFIKILRNTKDGASGQGVIEEVGTAIETAYKTLLYQLGLVKSGGNKRGFIKSQNKLTQDAIDALKRAWRNLYANNEENVVVLNNGLEFQESSNTSVEMQLNESKKTLRDEINGIFHISDDFYTTFKTAIYPIIRAFETALNRDLLLEKEKKNYFFEFDVKEILRANISERYAAYKLAKETGFMTLNEIRRAENMNDIDGLDVINVGLGAVLYDTQTGTYYTPNTDTHALLDTEKVIEAHEIDQAYDETT